MIGSPGVNLHAPGPIGDTTPSTLAGTTLSLLSTAKQFVIAYDGSNANQVFTGSNGSLNLQLGSVASPLFFILDSTGSLIMQVGGNIVEYRQNSGAYTTGNLTASANRPRYCTYSSPGSSADGIGGPAIHTVSVVINDLDTVLFTSTTAIFPQLISVPGGTNPVLTTTTAVTSGGAAALGTLTNAPTAGNPTKWIPFNDNGTTRYFPAW